MLFIYLTCCICLIMRLLWLDEELKIYLGIKYSIWHEVIRCK